MKVRGVVWPGNSAAFGPASTASIRRRFRRSVARTASIDHFISADKDTGEPVFRKPKLLYKVVDVGLRVEEDEVGEIARCFIEPPEQVGFESS